MTEPCPHPSYHDGRCTVCGQACEHDIILNGACYHCGSTELDGVALSPKPRDQLIPSAHLLRTRRESK